MNLSNLLSLSRSFVRGCHILFSSSPFLISLPPLFFISLPPPSLTILTFASTAPLTHASHASPRIMRAAVLRDIGVGGSAKEVVVASDVPVPSVSAGDVLIRVHASSINPLDNQMRFGYAKSIAGLKIDSPLILGRECSGVIEKVGTNVWNFKEGDEVVAATAPFRQAIDESEIALKPKNVSHLDAASLPFTSLTAWNAINIAKIERGMRVLVLGGSGRVGFTLLSILHHHFNCNITTTSSPQNMQKIINLGITSDDVIDHAQVAQLSSGFDAVFDVVGTAQSEAACVALVRNGGAYVTFNGSLVRNADELGLVAGFAQGLRESACKRVRISGDARGVRFGYALFSPSGSTLGTLMGMAEKGELVADVGKVFSLGQIGEAYDFCADGTGSGKVIIDVQDNVK